MPTVETGVQNLFIYSVAIIVTYILGQPFSYACKVRDEASIDIT